MSAILVTSILIRIIAFAAACGFWFRVRDWRLIFLALMLALMALRQVLTLLRRGDFSGISFSGAGDEFPGLVVSVLALMVVLLFQEMLRENADRLVSLERNDAYLAGVLNNSADSIIVIDEQSRILTFNRSAEQLFGYAQAEVIGQNVKILMPEPYHGSHDGFVRSYLTTGVGKIFDIGPRELTALRKDGTEIPIELAVGEMRVGADKRFIGMARDISLRKAQAAKLEQAKKLEMIGKVTGGIAHDFNNLLQVVIGNLEVLGEELASGSPAQTQQETALRASFRGADLIGRLLAYSRQQPLSPEVTDINALIPLTTKFIESIIGGDIEIETALADGLWPAYVDRVQLESVLLNLAVNARDAMPDGGKLVVETENTHLGPDYSETHFEVVPGQYVMVAVSDSGTGMAPEVVENAFDPFFTTKEVGQGSGLGLSMVYGFAKQSGGHAEILSKKGRGTTVRLYLPRSRKVGAEVPAARVPGTMTEGHETVLLVEDDADVRAFTVALLEGLGYSVLPAGDGPSAMAVMARSGRIDLLLTDVVLPKGMTGADIAAGFKERFPDAAVLFTSGYAATIIPQPDPSDRDIRFLAKPFTRAALAGKARDALQARRAG